MELLERMELDKIHDKTTLIIVQIVPTGSDLYCWLKFIDSVEIPFLGPLFFLCTLKAFEESGFLVRPVDRMWSNFNSSMHLSLSLYVYANIF